MKILIDMDGVLVDLMWSVEKAMHQISPTDAAEYFKKLKCNSFNELEHFKLIDNFDVSGDEKRGLKKLIHQAFNSKHTFLGAPVMQPQKTRDLINKCKNVYLCTSPYASNYRCISEKRTWVHEYIGYETTLRTFITEDKAMIRGDFLIDDKPEPNGSENNPTWEHIVYDQTYNQHVVGKKRLDADSLYEFLLEHGVKK